MKATENEGESPDVGVERLPPDAGRDLSTELEAGHGAESLLASLLDTAERATVELCGNERDGRRCILARNHQGLHECHTASTYHCWT